ncbi:MAG: PilN domain-containing protein [Candidatus Adiutrix sp.]
MITINLLPIGSLKQKHKGRVFIIAYGLFILIAACALFSYKLNVMDTHIKRLTDEQASRSTQLASLRRNVTDASKITQDIFNQWQTLEAIMELEERRRDQTRLLVELETLIPKEDAWLVTLNHDQDFLNIAGISRDKETVSQFLTQLENATHIRKETVNLMQIAQNMVINGINLTRFRITASTSFPAPSLIDEGLAEIGFPPREEMIAAIEKAAPNLLKDAKGAGGGSRRSL